SVTRHRSRVAPSANDAVHGHTKSHEHVSKYDPSSFQDMRSLLRSNANPILVTPHRLVNPIPKRGLLAHGSRALGSDRGYAALHRRASGPGAPLRRRPTSGGRV